MNENDIGEIIVGTAIIDFVFPLRPSRPLR